MLELLEITQTRAPEGACLIDNPSSRYTDCSISARTPPHHTQTKEEELVMYDIT